MKRIVSLILVVLTLCSVWSTAFAEYVHTDSGEAHKRDYKYVLFENGKVPKEKEKQFDALADALYLCIDWFDHHYNTGINAYGELLETFPAVKRIAKSADDFRFATSPSLHRSFTHRGWTYSYNQSELSKYHWPIRKNVLLATVYCCLEGNPFLGIGMEKNMLGKRYDSLACLLYNVHVLGDHLEDKQYKNMFGNGNGFKIDFVREHAEDTNRDILYDLEESIRSLFPKNQSAEALCRDLESVRKEELESMNRYSGVLTEEQEILRFAEHQDNCAKVLNLLAQKLPLLLAKETWFQEAFE